MTDAQKTALETALARPHGIDHGGQRNPAEGEDRICGGPINYLPKNHKGRY